MPGAVDQRGWNGQEPSQKSWQLRGGTATPVVSPPLPELCGHVLLGAAKAAAGISHAAAALASTIIAGAVARRVAGSRQ